MIMIKSGSMTLETVQSVPLTQWDDGSIRIKSSRLLIDMVVDAHKRGECPEEIFEAFPSDSYTVADIYAVIAYYLTNKKKIDRYMTKRENEAKKIREEIESMPGYKEKQADFRKTVLKRWEERKSA